MAPATPPTHGWFAQASHFFVSNRPLSYLLIITLVGFGLLAFFITPKQYNPEIVRPAFAITFAYDGATPAQAETRVVHELVQKIGAVPGVDDIYTTVTDGATIKTTVIFTVGYDKTQAKVDLRAQLEQHSYLARGFIQSPQIQEINPETVPVLQVVFTADDRSVADLRSAVYDLRPALLTVADVSAVEVVGGYPEGLVVEVDPELAAARGLSLAQVADTVATQQWRSVQGGIGASVSPTMLVVDNRYTSIEAVRTLPIDEQVTVGDVARVYRGTADTRSYVLQQDGETMREAVVLSVAKVEGSNAPVVTSAVRARLAALTEASAYDGVRYEVVADDGVLAEREIFGLTQNLILSVVIVAAVLFLFLSWRAALVVLFAIPLTFLVVFGIGFVFGETINRITLFALILSLGLLVDAAIVVTENVHRELRNETSDADRHQTVARAVQAVGAGLLLSLLTSVVVFTPMRFITGMMGPYMGPIAFFVPAALLVSFLVAVTVIPFLAERILVAQTAPLRLARSSQRVMRALTERYTIWLRQVLQERWRQRRILRRAAGLFALSLLLPALALVHFQMLPGADRAQLYLYIDLPAMSPVTETARVTDAVVTTLQQHDAVSQVQSYVGQAPIVDFNGLFKGVQDRTGSHQATLRVNLSEPADRSESSATITQALRTSVLSAHPELAGHVRFMEEPPGPPVRATMVTKIVSSDAATRAAVADALVARAGEIDGLVDVYRDIDTDTLQATYSLQSTALQQRAVSATAASYALTLVDEPQIVGEYLAHTQAEYSPIQVQLPPRYRDSTEAVDTIPLVSGAGEVVPLAAVTERSFTMRSKDRHYEDTQALAYVTGETADRSIVYIMLDLMRTIHAEDLAGFTVQDWGLYGMTLTRGEEVVELRWGGEWEMTLNNFRDLGIAMVMALLLVYAILVAQYRRFATPAFILVTVPLGLIGILWGFFVLDQLFGIYLTATALIGFIALIGLVVNNAIIYLEYVTQAQNDGCDFAEALVRAGSVRLRPIVLTSLTTVLGSLTIAFDPVWSGLAWAIVFGLSLSTVLTLVIYPILLVYFTAAGRGGSNHK